MQVSLVSDHVYYQRPVFIDSFLCMQSQEWSKIIERMILWNEKNNLEFLSVTHLDLHGLPSSKGVDNNLTCYVAYKAHLLLSGHTDPSICPSMVAPASLLILVPMALLPNPGGKQYDCHYVLWLVQWSLCPSVILRPLLRNPRGTQALGYNWRLV